MIDVLSKELGLRSVVIRLEKNWGSSNLNHRQEIRNELFRLNPNAPEVQDLNLLPKLKDQAVSISHTRGLGGFALASGTNHLGFDVELTSRVQSSQVNKISRYADETTEAPEASFFWTAKEASFKSLSKLTSIRGLSDLRIQNWIEISNGVVRFEARSEMQYGTLIAEGICWKSADFTFAIACSEQA